MESLGRQLRSARRRLRGAIACRWASAGIAAGLLAASIGIGWGGRYWTALWDISPVLLSAGLAAVGGLVGAVASLSVRLDDHTVARVLEDKNDLKDRVTSAVWAGAQTLSARDALIEDAAACLERVSLSQSIRLLRRRSIGLPAAALAVLAVVIMLPSMTIFHSKEARETRLALMKHGANLEKVAARLAESPAQDKALQAKLAGELDRLGRQLKSGRVSEGEARVKLNKMESRLQAQAEEMARRNAFPMAGAIPGKFAAARAGMAQDAAAKMRADAARGTPMPGVDPSKLPKMSGKGSGKPGLEIPPELAKRLAELYGMKDFLEAQKLMEELRRRLGLKPSAADQSSLALDLKALSQSLSEADLKELARQLLAAAKALEKMDPEEARRLLSQACKSCNKLGLGLSQCASLSQAGSGCKSPSGGYNQYGSTDSESRDSKGIGNPANAPRTPGANRLDKNWAKLYGSRRTEVKTKEMKAPSQIGESGQMQKLEVEGAPDPHAKSGVPYFEVYPQYRTAAEKAMTRQEVPVEHRKRVRDYFDSLR